MFDFGAVDVIVNNIEMVMSLMHLYNQPPSTPKNNIPESQQLISHWSVNGKKKQILF